MKLERSAERTRKSIARPSRTISIGISTPAGPRLQTLTIEIAEAFDLRPADARENVAAANSRFGGRSIFGDARDDDFIAIFGRKNAKPRAALAY